MYKLFSIFFVIVFTFISCTSIDSPVDEENANVKDILYLYEILEEKHPDFYNYLDETEAKKILAETIEGAENNTPLEQCFALSSVAAIAHDSHTSIGMSLELVETLHLLPIGFDYFEETLYIVYATEEYSSLLGKKVSSINGYNFKKIMDLASDIIPHDNEVFLAGALYNNFLRMKDFYEFLGIAEKDKPMMITIEDGSSVPIDAITFSQQQKTEFFYLQKAIPDTINLDSLYSAMLLPDPTALLINYHSCSEMEGFPFSFFAKKVYELVEKNEYKKIIIDLRYNGGGNSTIIDPLVGYLKEFKGEIEFYVLIGDGTFSSAILNAETLKNELGAILVGRPTGGSSSHFGEIQVEYLPESELTFQYSTKYFTGALKGPLMPDVLVERNLYDYEFGIDSDLKALGVL